MEEGAPCNVDLDAIDAVLPCQSGLVCRRVSVDSRVCMPEAAGQFLNHSSLHAAIISTLARKAGGQVRLTNCYHVGPCTRARLNDPQLDCDDDGNFEPLQCRQQDTGRFQCRCVEPSGTLVPDTEIEVRDQRDAPDCEDIGREK